MYQRREGKGVESKKWTVAGERRVSIFHPTKFVFACREYGRRRDAAEEKPKKIARKIRGRILTDKRSLEISITR